MKIRAAIAQFKPKKGDVEHNLARIGDIFAQIVEDATETDLLVLPETCLSGYFLEGGVRDVALTADTLFTRLLALYRERVATHSSALSLDICLGFYELSEGKYYNSSLYATLTASDSVETQNSPSDSDVSAQTISARIHQVHRKFFLPTYGVFDEERFVSRGNRIETFETRFGRIGMLICEDIWHSVLPTLIALKGAMTLIVPSASPGREFVGQNPGNVDRYHDLLKAIASEHGLWVIYAGLVGFEGGKGFTGSSQVVDPFGKQKIIASNLHEEMISATINLEEVTIARTVSPLLSDLESAIGDIEREFSSLRVTVPMQDGKGKR